MGLFGDIALIFVFILIGGVFASAEMALVSLRESQIKSLVHRGKRGQAIERLTTNPNNFLSAVQIGVTLSGFLSAAFGGATLSARFSPVLQDLGLPAGLADTLSLVLITVVISYFSIVLGELAAKRLAMQRAEGFALALAPMVDFIAKITRPLIWFLGHSTNVVVRILGGDPKASREEVSDEELRAMVTSSRSLGDQERHIVQELFDAGERSLREVMVPRTEVEFMPADLPINQAIQAVKGAPHSRYPVTDGSPDRVIGFLHVRDLMDLNAAERALTVRKLVRPVLSLPETVKVMRALSDLQRESAHLAIVRDEYGGTAGIVTMEDLVEELIGDITDEYDVTPRVAHDTISEVDGLTTIEEFGESIGMVIPEGAYDTVAGYFMACSGQLPKQGDEIVVELAPEDQPEDVPVQMARFQLRVIELDGRRAAWFSVRRLPDGLVETPDAAS